jgi:hypothetical protein
MKLVPSRTYRLAKIFAARTTKYPRTKSKREADQHMRKSGQKASPRGFLDLPAILSQKPKGTDVSKRAPKFPRITGVSTSKSYWQFPVLSLTSSCATRSTQ